MHELIITGLPRSGTIFVAALTDAREDVCCLSEPQRHVDQAETAADASIFAAAVGGHFASLRRELSARAAVMVRRGQADEAMDNYFAEPAAAAVVLRPVDGLFTKHRRHVRRHRPGRDAQRPLHGGAS